MSKVVGQLSGALGGTTQMAKKAKPGRKGILALAGVGAAAFAKRDKLMGLLGRRRSEEPVGMHSSVNS